MAEVSVILPTYNAAPKIRDALRSLSAQTFSEFEVLVIDDGSTDETVDIVREHDDNRFRLIQRDESGLPSALNRGIQEAEGTYLARQDADDVSHPQRLERQHNVMEKNESLALLGTGVYVEYSDRRKRQRHVLQSPSFEDLVSGNRFIHGSVMMRTNVVSELGGYDEHFEYTEDYDLWLRIAAKHPIGNIDEPLYTLRIRDESIYGTVLREVKLYAEYARMRSRGVASPELDEAVSENDLDTVYENLPEARKQSLHNDLAMELLRYGDPEAARTECKSALHIGHNVTTYLLYGLTFASRPVIETAIGGVRKEKNIAVQLKNYRTETISSIESVRKDIRNLPPQ